MSGDCKASRQRMALCCLALVIGTLVAPRPASAQVTVRVEIAGQVSHAGTLELPAQARLHDAASAAGVSQDAYVAGAGWYQARLLQPQQRLKAGIVFDLSLLAAGGAKRGRDQALANAAQTMLSWVSVLPVTGRRVAVKLDPDVLEISRHDNYLLESGDRLVYPSRPDTVRIEGAVVRPCALPQQALQDVRGYLAACPVSTVADKDIVYLIQPDGSILTLGIALWNRSAPTTMAPGSILFIPFAVHAVSQRGTSDLNGELAAFLATQSRDSVDRSP